MYPHISMRGYVCPLVSWSVSWLPLLFQKSKTKSWKTRRRTHLKIVLHYVCFQLSQLNDNIKSSRHITESFLISQMKALLVSFCIYLRFLLHTHHLSVKKNTKKKDEISDAQNSAKRFAFLSSFSSHF